MLSTFVGALILATTVTVPTGQRDPSDFENPRFVSPNGELCVVIRRYPSLGDFEGVTSEVYWRHDPIEEWLEEYPLPEVKRNEPREPVHGALYRFWPGGRQELLSEFALGPEEPYDKVLVADDGHFLTYGPVTCGATAELLTIRAPDGSVVRTLLVRDVITRNDQHWLCLGSQDGIRWSIHDELGASKLRATILVTKGTWNDDAARHETVEVDLATGAVPSPERDLCPPTLIVAAEADDGSYPRKSFTTIGDDAAFNAADVVSIASQAFLERATLRIVPEYPDVARKARISGRVRVDVVVGRNGRVEAARIQPLPFGIEQAVRDAIVNWEFATDPAEATRFSGSFLFRFEIVRPEPIAVPAVR